MWQNSVMFFTKKKSDQSLERVYLDWAAATPLLPEAYQAMVPFLTESFANPSAIHAEGQRSRDAVEEARVQAAQALQVKPEAITWTSGGTEGNNLAIVGTVEALHSAGRAYGDMEIITTEIEHPSVTKTVQMLAARGITVQYVRVHESGVIDLDHLRELLSTRTVLVSTAYINSEIGTIQPVHAIKKIINEAEQKHDVTIYLHLDAAQAPLWVSCQFDTTNADLLVLDAAKFCGPKGIGLLVRHKRTSLQPVMGGGGQEDGLRSGTENVAGIVGAAVALRWAQDGWRERAITVTDIRDAAVEHLLQNIPQAVLNGAAITSGDRVANNINLSIPGLDTEFATVVLDKHGFAVSTKSACSGAGGGASAVVMTTTNNLDRASSTLRITLGPGITLVQLEVLTVALGIHQKNLLGW